LSGTNREDVDDSIRELALLAETAGATVIETVVPSVQKIKVSTFVGTGKLEEIRLLVEEEEADLLIFDEDLSNVQLRNIEKEITCKILDRSALILDIFARNARTATAMTQVELAQLEYILPRLTRAWTHLSRQKGGIGMRGPGETQIETDRRLIGTRISLLKERLVKIDRQRTTQRKGRSQFTRISLVGYTNAGKSTLMNGLANSDVLAENKLFATLDSTTRQVELTPGRMVLLSDTVGFIRKLPHRLIESFKSTLDEVRESDILLHVLDASHRGFRDQKSVVHKTLEEIRVGDKPTLLVFNKIDALEDAEELFDLKQEFPDAAFVSALRGIGLSDLTDKLTALIDSGFDIHDVLIPVTDQKAIAHLRRIADVLDESYAFAKAPYEDETHAVVQLKIRVAPRYSDDVSSLTMRYRDLKLLPEELTHPDA